MPADASTFTPDPKRKVLLIGWDAADWQVIAPLLDAGQMPHLESLINRGVMGNLATMFPMLSPMLWTSIATGKQAWKHGIHGFTEPDPDSGSIRPISNVARKCKAIWNILNQSGLRSNVVGWWPSQPVEPINGVMVSDLYKRPNLNQIKDWPLQPGTIHPARLEEPLSKLRIHPLELEGEQLLPFVPSAAEIDQDDDKRLISVAKCMAECSSVHAAATAIMQLEPWDFLAVYYDAIDHFSHGFMQYHPPRLDWINEEDFERYKDVVASAYRYHDMMLGVLLQLAGDDTTVILMSDHGFHCDHLRPRSLPDEPAGPAEEHRPYGIVVMAGPGIKQDELVFGSGLLDIAPTILTLFDLPVGRDMDGRPLTSAFETSPDVNWIDSWEDVTGDDGRHPPDLQLDPVESQEAIRQLVDLGYIEEPDADTEVAVQECVREQQYNLARAYKAAGRIPDALEILESLWAKWPAEHRFGVLVFQACLELQQTERAREVLQSIRENKQCAAAKAVAELKAIEAERKASGQNPEQLDRNEQFRIRKLQRQATANPQTLHFLTGSLLNAEGKFEAALLELQQANSVQVHNRPDLHAVMGNVHLNLRQWKQAEAEFHTVLKIDPTNAAAHLGIARALIPQRRFDEVLAEATAAVGLLYHQPQAHFIAGLALWYLKRFEEAESEFQTAIAQNPVFPEAHRRLARLYNGPLDQPQRAIDHWDRERQSRERMAAYRAGDTLPDNHDAALITPDMATLGDVNRNSQLPHDPNAVVIVSGLPRSGTSMMMQMLEAGGLPILKDDHRPADESNPRGYQEFESARQLASTNAWIDDAGGKAVKIVAQLLPQLPLNRPYRIIFMERPLPEVVASQRKLLQRLNRDGAKLSDNRLAHTFYTQIKAVRRVLEQHSDHISVLAVAYGEAIADPSDVAAQVNGFLGHILDEEGMVSAVEPTLRHELSDTTLH